MLDEELMADVARGDEAAFAELLGRWEQPLVTFLWRQTGGREVEDLVQETWLHVVRSAARFDPSRRFSTWLFQIARNLAIDLARSRSSRPVETTSPAAEDVGATAPAERIEATLDADRLLGQLSPEQREVVVLRVLLDMDESEVSRIAGVPRGTVKSRLHHAIRRLSGLVRKEGP